MQQTQKSHLFRPWHAGVWGGPQSSAGSLLSPALMNPAGKMSNIMSLLNQFSISVTETVVLICPLLCEELPVSQKHWAPASWALTGCGWSGLCVSSLWSTQEDEQRDSQGKPKKKNKKQKTKKPNSTEKIKIQGCNPLTPLLFFRARICEALPGDMDPVTGLHHGDTERERERGRWGGMALA